MPPTSTTAAHAAPPGKRKGGKFEHGGRRAQVRAGRREEQAERGLEARDAAEGPQRVSRRMSEVQVSLRMITSKGSGDTSECIIFLHVGDLLIGPVRI